MQAHEVIGRRPVEVCEGPTRQNLPVKLQRQRRDVIIRPGAEVDGHIHRAGGFQTDDPIFRQTIERGERPADHHAPVRLHGQRAHVVVARHERIEAAVQRPVRIKPHQIGMHHPVGRHERAADQQSAVPLQRQRVHRAVGDPAAAPEGAVERAVQIQPRQPAAGDSVHRREFPADDRPAIRLQHQRAHRAVRAEAAREARVQRTVRIQARDEIPIGPVHPREQAAQHHPAVILHRHRIHEVVHVRHEIRIRRAVRVHPRHVGPRDPAHRGEETAEDGLAREEAVGEDEGHRAHRRVGPGEAESADVEPGVERAVGIQPHEIGAAVAIESREIARHVGLAVGRDREGIDRAVEPGAQRIKTIDRPGRAFVVADPHQGIGQARERPGEAEEPDAEEAGAILQRVVEERHGEGLIRHPVGEHQKAAGRQVIAPAHRRDVQRGETHPDDAGHAVGPHHRDQRVGGVLRHREHQLLKPERAQQEIFVGDGDERAARRADGRPADHVAQHDFHRTIRVGQIVVGDRHPDEPAAAVQIAPDQIPADRSVIVRRRRAVRGGGVENRDAVGATAAALHFQDRLARRLAHHVVRGREDQGAEDQLVVVHDRQHRLAGRPQQRTAARVGEEQVGEFVGFDERVQHDGHHETLRRFAIGKREHPGDAGVIQAGLRRTVRREVRHRDQAQRTAAADHGDHRVAHRLVHHEIRAREIQHAGGAETFHDRQRGIRQRSQRDGIGRHRVAQHQAHGQVPQHQTIVQNAHHHGHHIAARREGHHLVGRLEVHPGHRRPVGGGRKTDRHGTHQPAAAHQRDLRVGRALADAVARRRETDQAVVVQNRQHRRRRHVQRGPAGRVAQRQPHRPVAAVGLIIKHRHQEAGRRHPRRKSQHTVGRPIIHAQHRRAVGGRRVRDRHGVAQAPGADHRDHRIGGALGRRVPARRAEGDQSRPAILAADEPDKVIDRHAVEIREGAARENPAVRLHRQRRDEGVGPGAKVDAQIHRAAGLQPDDPVFRQAVERGERAAHEHPAVGLQGERIHELVGADPGIETRVQRTVQIQPDQVRVRDPVGRHKRAAHQNSAVRLPQQGVHRPAGNQTAAAERRVHGAVAIQAPDPADAQARDGRKFAADDDLPVGLQHQGAHAPVGPRPGREGRVQRAVRVQPRDEIATGLVDDREQAAQHDPAIILHRDGGHQIIRVRHEIGVEHAARVHPREVGPPRARHRGEQAPEHHLAGVGGARVNRHRPHAGRIVGA